ncbi:MAG: 23S rRNA (adenine(1618)-N(6))-methyltransferase RlmF [Elusimicrobia bacterium]|nr:23S rRNA (adenine(1618)-N(6))-methyltransferase RlmF [Elusimicrobiota bacterium]
MHPRNRHSGRYDFEALARSVPELARFVRPNPSNESTIDFADPAAVKTLNWALLKTYYGVDHWDLPPGYLCPPVPGRADHVHYAADLLGEINDGTVPRGKSVRVLDVGVGANCIYPIIGRAEYGWRFVGSEIDAVAAACAKTIVGANASLSNSVEVRPQRPPRILEGLLEPDERFDLTLCNPPFNASVDDADAGAKRKWSNLGRAETGKNFGGQGTELSTPGGEAAFASRMIAESAALGAQVLWFSTLISKSANLPGVQNALGRARPADTRTIALSQGQKKSRIVAWTFLDKKRRDEWRRRWTR